MALVFYTVGNTQPWYVEQTSARPDLRFEEHKKAFMNTLEQTHSGRTMIAWDIDISNLDAECDSNLLNHLNGISTQATFACVRKYVKYTLRILLNLIRACRLQGTFVACNSIRASRNLLVSRALYS